MISSIPDNHCQQKVRHWGQIKCAVINASNEVKCLLLLPSTASSASASASSGANPVATTSVSSLTNTAPKTVTPSAGGPTPSGIGGGSSVDTTSSGASSSAVGSSQRVSPSRNYPVERTESQKKKGIKDSSPGKDKGGCKQQ